MGAGRVELIFAMTGDNQLTAALSKANADLEKFAGEAKNSARSASAALDAVQGSAVKTGGALSGLVADITQLGKSGVKSVRDWADAYNEITGAIGNVLGKVQALGAFVSAGEEAANANVVFAKTWRDSAKALEEFRAATQGTIDDTTLQQRSRSMAMLGLTAQQSADAISAAFKVAAATGKETDLVLEQVLGGIRGRTAGLKALGVELDLGNIYRAAAADLGKVTTELTAMEKRAARTTAVLTEMANVAGQVDLDGLSFSATEAATAWTNLKSNLQVITFTALQPAIQLAADATGALADGISAADGAAASAVARLNALELATVGATDPMISIGRHVAELVQSGAQLHEIDKYIRTAGQGAYLTHEQIVNLQQGFRHSSAAGRELVGVLDDLDVAITRRSFQELRDFGAQAADVAAAVGRSLSSTAAAAADAVAGAYKPKKKTGGQHRSRLDESDLLVAGLYGTTEANLALINETIDELTARVAEEYEVAQAETERQRGLWSLRLEIERQGRLEMLAEGDRLGQLLVDHDIRRREIIREAKDEDRAALELELEDMQYEAQRRQELRDLETEAIERQAEAQREQAAAFREVAGAIQESARASASANFNSLSVATGIFAAFAAEQEGLRKGAPGAIAAIAHRSAANIKSVQAQYAVEALGEAGAAAASFAIGDFVGGGLHTLAAINYATAASTSAPETGGGGGGGGGGGSTGAALSAPTSQPNGPSLGGGSSMNIYVNGGYYFGQKDDAGIEVGRMFSRAVGTGFTGAPSGQ